MRPPASRRAVLGAILALPALRPAIALQAGPQGGEGWEMREQVWRIPVPARHGSPETALLEATLFRPSGPGPFPLLVFSHGQPPSAAARRQMDRPRFMDASRLFVGEGFAVLLPLRRGFGASEGEFLAGRGTCERLDLANNADTSANDILAVRSWAAANMPFLDARRTVLAGQSAGGFGSLAAGAREGSGIAGVVNFAGGLRPGDAGGINCEGWHEALVTTMERIGGRPGARGMPTVWLYAANDSYFGYGLAERLAEGWRRGGGLARFVGLPASGSDGHGFVSQALSIGNWGRPVRAFLAELRAAGRA
jgi:pimeloyl-ACP methyl ester carboxylesterase